MMDTELVAEAIDAGYGSRQVLHEVSLRVGRAEVVALIGPNGAGKSTLLKVIFGLLKPWAGRVYLGGQPFEVSKRSAEAISFCPQGQRVFEDLTVIENLAVVGASLPGWNGSKDLKKTWEFFPALQPLRSRYGRQLSGGEKQMLALARALLPRPKVLLLDEPTLGLSPKLARRALEQAVRVAREIGAAVIVAEHKVAKVLEVADRVYALRLGRIVLDKEAGKIGEDELKAVFV